ncbi:hypothetical protein LCGC14_1596170 [marine sediment metagenome]|uniref:Uncharacterized protein n=1 Tax=marine sediment metagenome TaxID=412755 RepID=A0A0F9LCU1_9ZZZZ
MGNTKGTSSRVPLWWRKIVRGNHKVSGCGYGQINIVGLKIQDHTSFSADDKEMYFEPYDQGMNAFEELIRFCRTYHLTFSVSPDSTWNPGETMLITIKEERKGNDLIFNTKEELEEIRRTCVHPAPLSQIGPFKWQCHRCLMILQGFIG